jgi:hypothetical protein
MLVEEVEMVLEVFLLPERVVLAAEEMLEFFQFPELLELLILAAVGVEYQVPVVQVSSLFHTHHNKYK